MRRKFPPIRMGKTHRANIGGTVFYLTVNCFEDGTPGEVFCKTQTGNKHGLQGWTDGLCEFVSLALQSDDYGVEKVCAHLIGNDFPPQGPTGEADIGIAKSFPDYLARYLRKVMREKDRVTTGEQENV